MRKEARFKGGCMHWTLSTDHAIKRKVVGQTWGATHPFNQGKLTYHRANSRAMLKIVDHIV